MRTAILVAALIGILAACSPHREAEHAVKDLLNDPESARFTEMRKASSGATCGLVNAKNRMGGYVGATPFFYEPVGAMVAIVGPVEDREFRSLYLAKDDFSKEYMEISAKCRNLIRFKDVCGVDYPATIHRLCHALGTPDFVKTLVATYK